MALNPKSAFQDTETLTLTGDLNSTAVDCRYYDRFSYQLDWSGVAGLSGTILPQVSNDGTTWADLENYWGDVVYTMATASGTQMWIFLEIPARYVRMAYTANGNTAGTGTLLFEGQRYDL